MKIMKIYIYFCDEVIIYYYNVYKFENVYEKRFNALEQHKQWQLLLIDKL